MAENALTKQFTEPERNALKALKEKLPGIIADASANETEPKSTSFNIWGVTVDPAGPPYGRVDVIIMKFLRARNLDVNEAATMLKNTIIWRKEFKVDGILEEKFPEDIFGKLGNIYGKDKGGRPVTYNLYGANQDLKAVFGDVDRFIRWRVALQERGVRELDFENVDQMLQVHDYEGVGMSSRDANSKRAASEATTLFQNYYPETLYKKFFVNVPSIFAWIFWLFKPLMSAQTFAKMSVVGSGKQAIHKELSPYISDDQLPTRYGGQATPF